MERYGDDEFDAFKESAGQEVARDMAAHDSAYVFPAVVFDFKKNLVETVSFGVMEVRHGSFDWNLPPKPLLDFLVVGEDLADFGQFLQALDAQAFFAGRERMAAHDATWRETQAGKAVKDVAFHRRPNGCIGK